jgi:hypothetical protein
MLELIDRYVAECDAGHAAFVGAINASVDLSHLLDATGSGLFLGDMQVAQELLFRAAHAQRASALLKLAAVMAKLEGCFLALNALPLELKALLKRDLDLRKTMSDDITAATIRPFATLVFYQDVWRLSPHLTSPQFQALRRTLT